MDLQIHRAESAEAEMVALLGRITFAETFGELFQNHRDDLRAYLDRTFAVDKIRRSLALARNAYWLALVEGLPMAYAKLKYPSPIAQISCASVGQLQKIYVLREFVGRGIGKPLLDVVLSHAAERSIESIWLDVLKQNARAIRFYEREGFSALGDDAYTIGAQTFSFRLMVWHGLRESG